LKSFFKPLNPEMAWKLRSDIIFSKSVTRQALEQGNISEGLANLSIVEEQFSVLTEET
jgi:hypothetical protein